MLIQFVTCILILSTGRFHVAGPMFQSLDPSLEYDTYLCGWFVYLFCFFLSFRSQGLP